MKICIDPGHGNHNGAVGPTGLDEDSCALAISQQLAHKLSALGVITRLTRNSDVFIELSERCAIANSWHADWFVSVHLNSNGSSAVGIETLYKSETGKGLAIPVNAAMVEATADVDRGVKKRDDLYVLNATNMPAILVETGFVSHPATEEKMRTPEYKNLLAQAICDGIVKHLELKPHKPLA